MCATSPNWSQSALASSAAARPGELLALPQLDAYELDAVAELEAACLASDGGRLKLEWPALRARPVGTTNDFIWMEGERVVGFLGLYQWSPAQLEFCGMVHPAHRRKGIGAALYGAAAAEVARRRPLQALMIVDRALEPGRAFAISHGGSLDHSEHRMQQRREPDVRTGPPPVSVRAAVPGDAAFVSECHAAAFGDDSPPADPGDAAAVARQLDGTYVIELVGIAERVGVMRVEREGGAASIYGFAVVPERQGRGFGRAALSMVTRELHRSGVGAVSLEVLSTNDSALHLYETCGFDAIGTEDYYSMPL